MTFSPLETEGMRERREQTDRLLIRASIVVMLLSACVLAYIYWHPVAGL